MTGAVWARTGQLERSSAATSSESANKRCMDDLRCVTSSCNFLAETRKARQLRDEIEQPLDHAELHHVVPGGKQHQAEHHGQTEAEGDLLAAFVEWAAPRGLDAVHRQ